MSNEVGVQFQFLHVKEARMGREAGGKGRSSLQKKQREGNCGRRVGRGGIDNYTCRSTKSFANLINLLLGN